MNLQLHDNEKILLTLKPHSRAVPYFLLSRIWHILVLIIIILGASLAKNNAPLVIRSLESFFNFKIEILILLGLILFVIAAWGYTKMVLNGYNYTITNQRCVLTFGFLSLNQRIIPFQKITDLDMQSTFFERLFGLGSVYLENVATVFSNKTSTSNNTSRLEGLSLEDCSRVMTVISQFLHSPT